MAISDDFYTPKQVAPKLRIHYRTLLRYIAEGNPAIEGMPLKRLSRSVIRIPKAKFNAWAGLD